MESTGNLRLDRQLGRWYPLIDIPQQVAMVEAIPKGVRFLVVPAGRRSGKTERAKRILAKQAMKNGNEKYFAAAPTQDQAKKIFFDDLCMLTLSVTHAKQPRVSPQPIIHLDNGTEIHVIGLDKPQRIEGVAWTGGVIDEIADVKEEAVEANIMPALNTVDPRRADYRAWCIFCGVPDGLNHYYRMADYAGTANDPDWGLFHWESEEILPPDVIEAAKRTMSAKQYAQEYKACHLPETEVMLFGGGSKRVDQICKGDVLCHLRDDGKIVPCTVEDVGETGSKPIVDATLETGEVVSASTQHRFKVYGNQAQSPGKNN